MGVIATVPKEVKEISLSALANGVLSEATT